MRTCGCTPYATSKVTPLCTPLRRRPPFFTASHHVRLLIPRETPPSYNLKISRSTLRRLPPLPQVTTLGSLSLEKRPPPITSKPLGALCDNSLYPQLRTSTFRRLVHITSTTYEHDTTIRHLTLATCGHDTTILSSTS